MNLFRLFCAGAFGALTGGTLVHNYIHSEHIGIRFFSLILGILIGSILAAFIYDPKGSLGAVKKAIGLMKEKEAGLRKGIRITLITILTVFTFTIASACTFLSWCLPCYIIGTFFDANGHSIYLLSFFATIISVVMAAELFCKEKHEELRKTLSPRESFSLARIMLFNSNIFIATYHIIRGIIKFSYLLWLAPLLTICVLICLSECKRRSMAMFGASLGIVASYFIWNPLTLFLIGGTSSVLMHMVLAKFYPKFKSAGEWIIDQINKADTENILRPKAA